jgi:DNA-binding NarL/FixJ family response regulator
MTAEPAVEKTTSPPRRILLADDYPPMMRALERLLTPAYEVVGKVADGAALVEAALRLQPDLVIVDLHMPNMTGLEACRRITRALPQTRVIVLTAAGDEAIAQSALAHGASAFVAKYRLGDELMPAIEKSLA